MIAKIISLVCLSVLLTSCGDGEEGLKEQTIIQSREEIEAQNANQQKWAKELMVDFKNRQDYIKTLTGTYEGTFKNSDDLELKVRLSVVSRLPYYIPDRRTPVSEIESNLKELGLNVNIIQWNIEKSVATGCSFEKIIPDYLNGQINLISSDCDFAYTLVLQTENEPKTKKDGKVYSIKSIKNQNIQIQALRESYQFPVVNKFTLKKVTKFSEVKIKDFFIDENEYIKIKQTKEELVDLLLSYQKISHTYTGDFNIERIPYKVRLSISPISPYQVRNRFYSYEELIELIDTLGLNIQATVWNKKSPLSAVGCVFEDIKIDLGKSAFTLISNNCNNIFVVFYDESESIKVDIRPSKSADIYSSTLTKEN